MIKKDTTNFGETKLGLSDFFFIFFIGPSYTNIRTPCRASNEGDLPPRVGAQTRPL